MIKRDLIAIEDIDKNLHESTFKIEYSPTRDFLLIKNDFLEKCFVIDKSLNIKKCLLGDGVFINDFTLIFFYNDSGYGYMNSDCYLYNILEDQIIKLSVDDGFIFFISFTAKILTKKNWLLMKDDFGGLYIYNTEQIIKNNSFTSQFCNFQFNDILKLISFSVTNKTLTYLNSEFQIIHTEVNLKPNIGVPFKIDDNLDISNEFYRGYCLDFHTIKSTLNPDGTFNTERTEIGELLYKYKYQSEKSYLNDIVELVNNKFMDYPRGVDVIIPIPPSDTSRKFQPVTDISRELGKKHKIPVDTEYLLKIKNTPILKSIDDNNKRREILKNAFDVKSSKYNGKVVLLFDDLYRSGETLNAAAKIMLEKGNVKSIYALVITKTRKKYE